MDYSQFVKVAPKVIDKFEKDNPKEEERSKLIAMFQHGVFVVAIPSSMGVTEAYKGVWDQVLHKEEVPPEFVGVYLPKMLIGDFKGDAEKCGDVMFIAQSEASPEQLSMLVRHGTSDWTVIDTGPLSEGEGMAFDLMEQMFICEAPFNLMAEIDDPGPIIFDGIPIDMA